MEAAAWALVAATVGLVVATLILARHTKVLAKLTGRIVEIEKRRDHRKKLETAIDLARKIQTLPPETFIMDFSDGREQEQEQADYFRKMELYSDLIKDMDTVRFLRDLVQTLDDAQSQRSIIGSRQREVAGKIKTFQDRIQLSIDAWREESQHEI